MGDVEPTIRTPRTSSFSSRPSTREAGSTPLGLGRNSSGARQHQKPPSHHSMPDVHSRRAIRASTGGLLGSGDSRGLTGSRGGPRRSTGEGGRPLRPGTAPGSGSMANLQLAKRRTSFNYEKKLSPYRDLGVNVKLAETEMADWAHEHETDVKVDEVEGLSHRTVADLRLQLGKLSKVILERTATYAALRDELGELEERKAHIANVKDQWETFKSQNARASDALGVIKREYSDRNNQTPVGGGTDDSGKFWSVRIVDPGSRADPTLAERVVRLEEGEENVMYETAKLDIESKGYDLMVKRENGNLTAANDLMTEMQQRHKDVDGELGAAKSKLIDAKRSAENSQQECVKFVNSQRERRLLRRNTLRSKKLEVEQEQQETRRMEKAENARMEKARRNEKILKTSSIKMQGAVTFHRAAVEGFDERMGSPQEFEKYEKLRRVTQGAFPADVVDIFLAEYAKQQKAQNAADDAEVRLASAEMDKKTIDDALKERMSGVSSAKTKEFNAKQDDITERLNDVKKKMRERSSTTTEMLRTIAFASQGIHSMMEKVAKGDDNRGGFADTTSAYVTVESAVDASDLLSRFEKLWTASSLLEVAAEEEQRTANREAIAWGGGGGRRGGGGGGGEQSFGTRMMMHPSMSGRRSFVRLEPESSEDVFSEYSEDEDSDDD